MTKTKGVPIEKCDTTMILREDLYNEGGLLLLTKGTQLTRDKLDMLVRRGVETVPAETPVS